MGLWESRSPPLGLLSVSALHLHRRVGIMHECALSILITDRLQLRFIILVPFKTFFCSFFVLYEYHFHGSLCKILLPKLTSEFDIFLIINRWCYDESTQEGRITFSGSLF